MRTLAIIPARGGSKGIPRKNLRPLAGKPLLFYSINACLRAKNITNTLVTTDDEEIALLAERFGANALIRSSELSGDDITLDPVIYHAVLELEKKEARSYDLILTVQPTSPLLEALDIERCIELFRKNSEIETVISATEDRHLRWNDKDGKVSPSYIKRVNRQQLPLEYKETGAIIACRRHVIESGSRIGKNVELFETPKYRSIDIDTISDLFLCESLLKRKRIVFNVIGDKTTGTGHVNRALLLASELVNHEILFITPHNQDIAAKLIKEKNYPLVEASVGTELDTILLIKPDLIINDILDTNSSFVKSLIQNDIKVVNFEDLGEGSKHAHITFNALYPHDHTENTYSGMEYFCLRDEFLFSSASPPQIPARNILITMGGVDEGNLTCRTLSIAYNAIQDTKANCKITIVLGPGFLHKKELERIREKTNETQVEVINNTRKISDYMLASDFAITSAGRTVLEIASLGRPVIAICQNDRETKHAFIDKSSGIINLGHREALSDNKIYETIHLLLSDKDVLGNMSKDLEKYDFKQGKTNVTTLINQLLESKNG